MLVLYRKFFLVKDGGNVFKLWNELFDHDNEVIFRIWGFWEISMSVIKEKQKRASYQRSLWALALLFLVAIPDSAAHAGVWDDVVASIGISLERVPKLMAAIAYITGMAFVISAIFKFKDHVDSSGRESLKSPIVRLIIGGALIALPTVMEAMINAIGYRVSSGVPGEYPIGGIANGGLGALVENLSASFSDPERLFSVLTYLFGLGFAIWALVEFVKTADNPGAQAPIRRPIMILLTGSALLALPTVTAALRSIMTSVAAFQYGSNGLQGGQTGSMALDQILVNLVTNIHGPLIGLLGDVCFIAGLAFAMVGVFRLMKSAQDGPKAPWGMGTIGTFLSAAALLSLGNFMGGAQVSLFGTNVVSTYAVLAQSQEMDAELATRANQAIQAVFMFVQIVGWFSFVRGIFILRSYGEGDGQASMSAGFTHIIGGALAVNLTALVNAVQETLGLVGLTF